LPPLPIVYVKAVPVQASWEPSAVGYLRRLPDIYEAPVYYTSFRGPTYIFLATLKTVDPNSKWVLTGTAVVSALFSFSLHPPLPPSSHLYPFSLPNPPPPNS